MPTGDPDELLAPKEVAAFLKVTGRTLRRWVDDGTFPLPAVEVGKVRRWWRRDVLAWALTVGGKRGHKRTEADR